MKNKLTDLNNHLFAQLERLGEEELRGDDLTEEISRAKAITSVAQQIVNNGNLVLNALKTKGEYFPGQKVLPEIFADVDTADAGEPVNATKTKRIPDRLKDGYD